jgi:hypothetical protein
LNPSNWESGLTASPSRKITKEGPPALRLAYYQAANIARRHDPDLAAHYYTLMVTRRHNHISANCAIARKLAGRAWAVLQTGQPYVLRDLDGNPVDWHTATATAIATTPRRAHHRPAPSPRHRQPPRSTLGLTHANSSTSARTAQPQATADNPPRPVSVNPQPLTAVRKSGQSRRHAREGGERVCDTPAVRCRHTNSGSSTAASTSPRRTCR